MLQESRFSKMEKADILEMTVQHLRAVQRREQRAPGGGGGPGGVSAASRYRAGFTECAHEVRRYLAAAEGVSASVHERLVSHLEAIARRNSVLNGAVSEGVEAEGVKIEPVLSPVTMTHTSSSSSSSSSSSNPSSVSNVSMNSSVVRISSPSSVSNVCMDSGVMSVSSAAGITATLASSTALPLSCVAVTANSYPTTMTTTAMTQLPIRVASAGNLGVLGSSHFQHPQYTTLTINGTTARILLAPGPVTLIAPPQALPQALPQPSVGSVSSPAQAHVASDLRPGTAIPLYIHTHHLPSQHLPSPGASDGESGGSVSPVSMSSSTSNTSNASSSQHWPHADQHPTESHVIEQHSVGRSIDQSMGQSQRPFPIKIQPEGVYDPVWRPW